ncbi:hypothetical protein [Vagococcus fluvialis]|uniref:hypothetical protein n=1 Tax=Vagococcus fluvialis TaxID=2738 RepID=UPI00379CAC83
MKKKLLKSEKIRMKNDKLRAQGVDLEKRWGKKMVNSGITSSAMAGSPGTNPANLESKGTKALNEQDKK